MVPMIACLLPNSLSDDAPEVLYVPSTRKQVSQCQAAWGRHLGLPVEQELAAGIRLRLIPPGRFQMGATLPLTERARIFEELPDWQDRESPQHSVFLTKPFYMLMTEVTRGQWYEVMGSRVWEEDRSSSGKDQVAATCITWDAATEFCRRLSDRLGERIRLPTEAEWEYACRSGSRTLYSFGDSPQLLDRHAWFSQNTWLLNGSGPQRVAAKPPNAFGLYDMHGNVREWCNDWLATYPADEAIDPTGPESGRYRVHRGGSWMHGASVATSSYRYGDLPATAENHTGFRFVMELSLD